VTPEQTENPLGGYGKTIAHVLLSLKTAKGVRQLRLDPSIYEGLQKERVSVGDVIYIEANSGEVKRVGRSDAYATEHDLEAEEYVPVPKGDVHKRKDIVQDITLHDLDVANARPQVWCSLSLSLESLSSICRTNTHTHNTHVCVLCACVEVGRFLFLLLLFFFSLPALPFLVSHFCLFCF